MSRLLRTIRRDLGGRALLCYLGDVRDAVAFFIVMAGGLAVYCPSDRLRQTALRAEHGNKLALRAAAQHLYAGLAR